MRLALTSGELATRPVRVTLERSFGMAKKAKKEEKKAPKKGK